MRRTGDAILHRAILLAAIALACVASVRFPAAAADAPAVTQTFSIVYWPTIVNNQVTLTGAGGSITSSSSYAQPYLIFDYRFATPSGWGGHLYYAPLLDASGLASGTSTSAGLWARR